MRPEIIEHLRRKELMACRRVGTQAEMFRNVGYVDRVYAGGQPYSIATVYSPTRGMLFDSETPEEGNAITLVFEGDFDDFAGMCRYHGWLLTEEEAIQKHIKAVNDFLDGRFEYADRS